MIKSKPAIDSVYWLWVKFHTQTLLISRILQTHQPDAAITYIKIWPLNTTHDKSRSLVFPHLEHSWPLYCWHQCSHVQAAWAISDSTIGESTCLRLLFTPLTGGLLRTHCLSLTAVCSPAPFRALLCFSYLQANQDVHHTRGRQAEWSCWSRWSAAGRLK